MSELSSALRDTVNRLFSEQVDREFLQSQEDAGWADELWSLIDELGLTQVIVSEANGGVGGDWADAYEIVRECGRFAVPLPIPETLTCRWLLDQAGLDQPAGPLTLVSDGSAPRRVPWARNAVAACLTRTGESGTELALVELSAVDIERGTNLAREPRDSFPQSSTSLRSVPVALPHDAVLYLGAMLRSAQIAGAAVALLEQAVQYAGERVQFGRQLNKFQAVQHNLACLASTAASLDAVSRHAFSVMDSVGFTDDPLRDARLAIAAAKCRASDCVDLICRIAHQVHGAIGFTHEHSLHFHTRRAWSWRSEFGSGSYWARHLGSTALEQGADVTWELFTAMDAVAKSDMTQHRV